MGNGPGALGVWFARWDLGSPVRWFVSCIKLRVSQFIIDNFEMGDVPAIKVQYLDKKLRSYAYLHKYTRRPTFLLLCANLVNRTEDFLN